MTATTEMKFARTPKNQVPFRVTFGHTLDGWAVTVWVRMEREIKYMRGGHRIDTLWSAHERYPISGGYGTQELRSALITMYTDLFVDRMTQQGYPVKNMRAKEMKKWQKTSESTTS